MSGKRRDSADGTVTGTGSAISVTCGFKPKRVVIINTTDEVTLDWVDDMTAGKGFKRKGVASGTATFTGTSPTSSLNLATPAFSGTGLTAAGQVITTTDNQTMTLNQCEGMWLISATKATPPNLILSNTAVTGAPAVLTVQGAASTDAGAYKIVKALTPVGTVSFTGAAGDAAFISTGGVTPTFNGFDIGTDADLNVSSSTLYWYAEK